MCICSLSLQVFADLVDVKIDKTQLDDLIEKGAPPEARGAFGAVYKRVLRTKVGNVQLLRVFLRFLIPL